MRSFLSILVVVLAGCGVLWQATDGLRALTAEQARRLAVKRTPLELPRVTLQDHHGQMFELADYRGGAVLVDFIYTRCLSYCRLLSARLYEMNRLVAQRGTNGLRLLSITFDPGYDTTAALARYARHFRADDGPWRFARVRDPAELQGLLAAFGIVVLPDGNGGYQHNGALHLLDRDGRLSRIIDYDAPQDEFLALLD